MAVVIAHKLQVMRSSTRIILLDAGENKEHGAYDWIIACKVIFATLPGGLSHGDFIQLLG